MLLFKMSLTIRSLDIRSEFDKYLTQQKLCFNMGAELAYIHQSCCFVRIGAALRNSREARTMPQANYLHRIRFSQLSVVT